MRSSAPSLGAALALTVAGISAVHAAGASAPAHATDGGALARLAADSTGSFRVARGPDGTARVVALSGRSRDPLVDRTTGPRAAARAHLSRYGAALGLADPGTRLVAGTVTRSVTGDDVVRFGQRRHGLPVIGGAVAVDLRSDRQLGAVTASVSRATVPAATYPRQRARAEALAVVRRESPTGAALTVQGPVRRLYDPAVWGVARTADPTTHARGVWQAVVRGGPALRRLVLVDDRTGAVVQDVDQIETLDRVVCDNNNDMTQIDVPCTKNFARTENGPASPVPDVNQAFVLAGVVSSFYHRVAGIDLTRLLGVRFSGAKHLSSTVRYCDPFQPAAACPLANAFWNGVGMFYGQGFASADDVVGHEMTHGVIQHNADLLYWGQSGAINESLADVMGEIIDHRHPSPGDSAGSWALGEDLPIGAIRNLKAPGRFGQPASMTDHRYVGGLDDNGGVHTDSGVGNRTFYLISQGGRQHGEVVHGIDGASLKKTATLYFAVIQHLVSGSDYADLAAVLDQSCAALQRHGTVGFTAGDCRNVHRATRATRLRTTPSGAPQPADAPMSCPRGAGPVRVLFDSERGHPASKFSAGPTWERAPVPSAFPPVPANATSGRHSWYSVDSDSIGASPLRMRTVPLPAGRPAYLWFQQWRLLDFGAGGTTYDAGTVEVADATRGGTPRDAAGSTWVNGPHNRISDQWGNPAGGRLGFGKDSRGYLASRVSFHRYAGHAVRPQFTMNTDNTVGYLGWYLDDVRVYTCGRGVVPRSSPRISGHPKVGAVLRSSRGSWSRGDVHTAFRWYVGGHPRPGATSPRYHVRAGDAGKRISVRVTARSAGHGHAATFSPSTAPVTG
ncbi:MAG TPA: M4 family metallopeptidase [Nocardioides sp.]|jgi:Zn-dependent metalloprotease|nr:M4 family metallopeptidase [Nocardioides sp.]